MEKQKILAAGGDLRMIYAARKLSEKYDVEITGFQEEALTGKAKDVFSGIAGQTVKHADLLLLPPLTVNDKGMIPAPFGEGEIPAEKLLCRLGKGGIIFGGNDKGIVREKCEAAGFEYIDYINSTSAAQANAVPTAEGAIKTAMEASGRTMWKSRALVTGGGRIGTLLAERLHSMGAAVTAAARKRSDRIRLEALGVKTAGIPLPPEIIGQFNMIFNTVPAEIFGEKELEKIDSECVYIELASTSGINLQKDKFKTQFIYIRASGLPPEDMR